tara:strand:+ start:487 stop:825 length:339 start_codon:yes stop_codon:yes gene_type:complete
MDDAAFKINQLQKWRARKVKDISIDHSMNQICKSMRKTTKQLSEIQQAWNELVPHQFQHNSIPISFKGGVLEVAVDASPTAYQMNRLVRAGLLRQLQKRCSGALKKIKVTVE